MKRPVTALLAILALSGGAWLLWRQASPILNSQSAAINPRSAVANPPAPILTPSVAALLTSDPVPLAARLDLLSAVGNNLPAADRRALLDSIGNTPPSGLTTADWHSLANDILQTLRNQQPYTPEYTDRLLALWHDKSLDPTLRDYALQQLREWVADGDTRSTHEERPEKIALIRRTFLQAATPGHPDCDSQSTTTGTALLALDEWTSSPSPHFSAPEFQQLLLAHAGGPDTHRGVRATALQLCARRHIRDALPIARSILADTSSPAILSLSAVSLLGSMGTPGDADLLRGIHERSSRDPMLQAALHDALRKLAPDSSSNR